MMNIVDKTMKNWTFDHPNLAKSLSLLMAMFDHNLEIYTLRMEYTDAIGRKYKVAKAVSAKMLRAAKDPYNHIYTLLDEMFGELVDSKSETVRKEKKEMPPKSIFTNEEIKTVTFTPIDNDQMLKMAKAAVVTWYNDHNAPATIGMEDVYIVWFCKTLQNWKALAGTHHGDGMYYEITFDGDKDCAYVDAYKKWQNVKMEGSKLREEAIKK